MADLIEQLQKTPSYTVTEIGGDGDKVNTITNYKALNSKSQEAEAIKEIETADLVGPRLLQNKIHTHFYHLGHLCSRT